MFQNVQSLNKSSGKQTENNKIPPVKSWILKFLQLSACQLFWRPNNVLFLQKKVINFHGFLSESAGSAPFSVCLSLPSSLASLPANGEPWWMSSVGGDGCWAASPSLHQANVIKRYLAPKWRWLRPLQLTDEHPGRRPAVAASSLLVYIQKELMEATGRHFIHGLSRNSNKARVMN